MQILPIGAALSAVLALGACTTTTHQVIPGAPPEGTPEESSDPATPDAGSDASTGGIGTRRDTGPKRVDVDISGKGTYTCGQVCKAAGGSCVDGKVQGVGRVFRKYNDGSGTLEFQVSTCSDSESWASGNTTMTSMYCICEDMPAPPTVRVRKKEGLHTCNDVCASWSLTCSAERRHYSYPNEEETSYTELECDEAPPATVHHYECACDP